MIGRRKRFCLVGGLDSTNVSLDKSYLLLKLTTGLVAFIISAMVSAYAMEEEQVAVMEEQVQAEGLRANYMEDYSLHWHIEISIENQGVVTGSYQHLKTNCHEHWRSDCWQSQEIKAAITGNQLRKLAGLIDAADLPFQVGELTFSPPLAGRALMLEVYINNKKHWFASSVQSPSDMHPGFDAIRRLLLDMAQIKLQDEAVFFDVQK